MNPSTLSRIASSSASSSSTSAYISVTRAFSTSSARCSGTSSTKKGIRKSQASASPEVLRKLVNLHHASSTFLHDPKEASTGFDNAFRYVSGDPYFMSYRAWKDSVMTNHGGESTLIDYNQSLLGSDSDKRAHIKPAPTYNKIFKKRATRSWSGSGSDTVEVQSDREVAVREALFGTWERGGMGMKGAEPGMDGVKEWLNARGVTVEQFAREWEMRNDMSDSALDAPPSIPDSGLQIEGSTAESEAGEEFGEVRGPNERQ